MALQALTWVAEREGGVFLRRRQQYDVVASASCPGRSSRARGNISAGRRRSETAVPESDTEGDELRDDGSIRAQLNRPDVRDDDFRGRAVWRR